MRKPAPAREMIDDPEAAAPSKDAVKPVPSVSKEDLQRREAAWRQQRSAMQQRAAVKQRAMVRQRKGR